MTLSLSKRLVVLHSYPYYYTTCSGLHLLFHEHTFPPLSAGDPADYHVLQSPNLSAGSHRFHKAPDHLTRLPSLHLIYLLMYQLHLRQQRSFPSGRIHFWIEGSSNISNYGLVSLLSFPPKILKCTIYNQPLLNLSDLTPRS